MEITGYMKTLLLLLVLAHTCEAWWWQEDEATTEIMTTSAANTSDLHLVDLHHSTVSADSDEVVAGSTSEILITNSSHDGTDSFPSTVSVIEHSKQTNDSADIMNGINNLTSFEDSEKETDAWSMACPRCVNNKRIVGFNIVGKSLRTDSIIDCLDRCDSFDECASIEYNTKRICHMNTRVLDSTDVENKEGWVYCPRRPDPNDTVTADSGCQNGASCSEGGCVCPEGTSGDLCEIIEIMTTSAANTSDHLVDLHHSTVSADSDEVVVGSTSEILITNSSHDGTDSFPTTVSLIDHPKQTNDSADIMSNRNNLTNTGRLCELSVFVGPCRAAFPRWYYDSAEQQCKRFLYGGCDGNENNFETLELCQNECNTDDHGYSGRSIRDISDEDVLWILAAGEDITPNQDGGVRKEVGQTGRGSEYPQPGDTVFLHYAGTLDFNEEVESSASLGGEMFSFVLGSGSVIPCWDLAVSQMKRGEVANVICQPQYAYGEAGKPPSIPSNATLIYELQLFRWTSNLMDENVKETLQEPTTRTQENMTMVVGDSDTLNSTTSDINLDEGDLVEVGEKTPGQQTEPPTSEPATDVIQIRGTDISPEQDGGVLKYLRRDGVGSNTPNTGDSVYVHYKGLFMDGRVFESSYDSGDPLQFILGRGSVIPCWDIGIATMKAREHAVLTCRADYAYGDRRMLNIPPNTTLIFQVELIAWKVTDDIRLVEVDAKRGRPSTKLKITPDDYDREDDFDEALLEPRVILKSTDLIKAPPDDQEKTPGRIANQQDNKKSTFKLDDEMILIIVVGTLAALLLISIILTTIFTVKYRRSKKRRTGVYNSYLNYSQAYNSPLRALQREESMRKLSPYLSGKNGSVKGGVMISRTGINPDLYNTNVQGFDDRCELIRSSQNSNQSSVTGKQFTSPMYMPSPSQHQLNPTMHQTSPARYDPYVSRQGSMYHGRLPDGSMYHQSRISPQRNTSHYQDHSTVAQRQNVSRYLENSSTGTQGNRHNMGHHLDNSPSRVSRQDIAAPMYLPELRKQYTEDTHF